MQSIDRCDPSVEAAAERVVQQQTLQLDAVLGAITQGLCMFDAQGQIVLSNRRYAEMMGLPLDENLAGLSLLDVLKHRKKRGTFLGDPDQHFADVLGRIRQGQLSTAILQIVGGPLLRITYRPMSNGGWVSTFEDITEQKQVERERDRDREFLHKIIDNIPVMIAVKEVASRKFILVNQAAERIWGMRRINVLGRTAREIFPLTQAEMIEKVDQEAISTGTPIILDAHPNFVSSGSMRTVTSKRLAIKDSNGDAAYLVSVVEDITDRTELERQRDRDRQFLNQIVNNVPVPILVRDARTMQYVLINDAASEYIKIPRDKVVGKKIYDVWPAETADIIDGHDRELLKSDGHVYYNEHAIRTPSEAVRFVTSKRSIIRGADGTPLFLLTVLDDVTERRHADEKIVRLAHYDALTDLPNRALFRDQLERVMQISRPDHRVALLYLDLDHFKSVNDTLGHPIGDELLKLVAGRLRSCIRDTDIIARLGGDEFAIIRSGVQTLTEVTNLAGRILATIREPSEFGGHQLLADTSIGIAISPDDGQNPDELLKNADLAMYRAKTDGRGSYCFFEPAMDATLVQRRTIEQDLRQAIADQQFELHYQPIWNFAEKRFAVCEGLLRWRHPEKGLISPGDFIPIAEETGLITRIGEWVLNAACKEAATWPSDIKVAVNVSPVQIKRGDLFSVVMNALSEGHLAADRLELEITEAVVIHDDDKAVAVLQQLRSVGVRIAMDDFGTGYSSLSYLQRFPFDKIKIDRSFIEHVADSNEARAIIQAIVSIAAARNLVTTAEGVETQTQTELLKVLGCTEMQGYFLSRPVPAAALRAIIDPASRETRRLLSA